MEVTEKDIINAVKELNLWDSNAIVWIQRQGEIGTK